MHIALVISSLETGGAERMMSELANVWASQGRDVSLITLSAPGTPSLYPLDPRVRLIQLDALTVNIGSQANILVRLKNITLRIVKLRWAFKTAKPDVIVSFVDIMNISTILASRWLGIPVVVSERIDPNHHRINTFYQQLRLQTYPMAQKLVVQTLSAKSYFPSKLKCLISIIPNFVKPAVRLKNARPTIKRIVSVGRLSAQKDHKTLILAFSQIVEKHPDLELIIYGEGKERLSLERLITNLNIAQKVYLPGVTSNIQKFLLEADLFVFPSRYEGFPNALCEAMAVGLPVIASNCSGTTDIVRDGIDGRLFPIGDVNQLAVLLRELIEDPSQRQMLSQGALAVSDRFSQASVLQLWDDVLRQVVGEKNH